MPLSKQTQNGFANARSRISSFTLRQTFRSDQEHVQLSCSLAKWAPEFLTNTRRNICGRILSGLKIDCCPLFLLAVSKAIAKQRHKSDG